MLKPTAVYDNITSLQSYVKDILTDITADVLRIDHEDLDLSQSFLSLGGDSITAIKMMARCRAKGITLNVADMIEATSIAELCETAYSQSPDLLTSLKNILTEEAPVESHNLSMLQERYAETGNTEARVFNLNAFTSYENLQAALSSLVERHHMLRVKLTRTDGGQWGFQESDFTPKSFRLELHAVDSSEELVSSVMRLKTRIIRPKAPLFSAILFEMASGSLMLALAAHGAVMDETSWELLAIELRSLLGEDEKLVIYSRYFRERPWEEISHEEDRLATSVQYFESEGVDHVGLSEQTLNDTLEQTEGDFKPLVFNETHTALLLNNFGNAGNSAGPMGIIHSALVVAAATTTSNNTEDITFVDIHKDRSKVQVANDSDAIGCFDSVSELCTRVSPFDQDAPLLYEKVSTLNQSSLRSFAGLQHRSGNLTPPSDLSDSETSSSSTVFIDSRKIAECAQEVAQPISQLSNLCFPKTNQNSLPLLSISLLLSKNRLGVSFLADSKWCDTYDLEDFVNVFRASISGILRRLRNTQSNIEKGYSLPAPQNTALSVAGDDKFKEILSTGIHRIEAVLPCSPIQEGFLISQSTNPNLYQCCFIFKFTGNSSVDAWQIGSAWKEVVKRHTILRTVLIDSSIRPGHFDQIVLDDGFNPSIEYHDWTQLPSPEEFNLRDFIPFQPSVVPHRAYFAQTTATEVYMKLEISHALADGQSTDVIIRDLYAAYRGSQAGTPSLTYGEFVAYQSQLPTEKSQAYWSEYLSNAEPTFLPMDRGHEGLSELETLNTKLRFGGNVLADFCSKYSVTLSNVCQLAWGLTIRAFTGSDNVTFSYPTSGRSAPLEGLHNAVGPFVSTLLCNIHFGSNSSIQNILKKISKDSLESLYHPYKPESHNNKSVRQFVNTSISFQRVLDLRASEESALHFSVIKKSNPTDYDITVGIEAERDALSIDLDFWKSRTSLYHAKTVLKTFREAIFWVLQNPHKTSAEVSLVGAQDKTKLLEWNQEFPEAIQRCLHEVISDVAKQHPEAPAICAWDGNLTYHELVSKASTLAHRLIGLGVAPESAVGLCMDKSKWAITSMLAILQAGGVVVPLGVSHPLTRIDGIVDDTEAKIVLVDELQASRLEELSHKVLLLKIDETMVDSLPVQVSAPSTTVSPRNAAWVIFTSGSTGRPKGVVLEHKSLSTSVAAHGAAFGVSRQTRAGQFAAYTFDVSISDIMATLHRGGCVCVFSEEDRMNNLTEALQTFRVNYVNMTPTVMRLLDPSNLPLIKTAVVGGEPLDPKLVERWSSQARVINSYGPSECAIISTCYSVSDPAEASIVGFPTATRLWVTEMSNPDRLCAIGVPGELLIDGPLLARGYLNDPTKTTKSFIKNPLFAADLGLPPNLRFYRSGDLVRMNENGSITHFGRRDGQLKIRGQRAELGEIEHSVMSSLNDARMVAVLATKQGQQNEQVGLVAVIEFDKTSTHYHRNQAANGLLPATNDLRNTFDELRTSLFNVLPAYMVPSLFLPILEMPLNPSGKLDRRALGPLVDSLNSKDLQQYTISKKTAISTETERELQSLWSQVLGIDEEEIGADDHFLQIGGDSVTAIRLVAACRKSKLRVHIIVADILQHPRLSELAKLLDDRVNITGQEPEYADAAPFELWGQSSEFQPGQMQEQLSEIAGEFGVTVDKIEDAYPCTPLQEGLMAITARQPTAYINHQVFSLAETIDMDRFQEAWQKISLAAPILRTRILFRPNSTSLQIIIRDSLQWERGSSLKSYLQDSRSVVMSPGKPLNQFGLVKEASGKLFFVWSSHHSTYDGWSRNLILQQVAEIYHRNSIPRSIPYTRFIRYLSQADSETSSTTLREYWEGQLNGDPVADFPPLPHVNYHPRPRQRLTQTIDLPESSCKEVIMTDVLRAGWALVLGQHAGNDNPVFAVTLSGRDAPVPDIASIPAPTITTLPLCIRIDGTQTVNDFLETIRKQRIEMIPHQHTGLQRIKQLLPHKSTALELRSLFVIQLEALIENLSGIAGMQEEPVEMEEFDSYGLNVECSLSLHAVTMDVRFDEKVISAVQVDKMLGQFALLVKQLYSQAGLQQRVGDLEYLTQKDVRQIKEWNGTLPSSVDSCIHHQVVEMARSQQQSLAVCSWDGNFTYAELITQAATLSHFLLKLDPSLGPEAKIGLCMDKSKWAIVAMLAILLTGGAVVPLGVSHPLARIDHIVNDTAARLILVDQTQAERLPSLGEKLITVDSALLGSLRPAIRPPPTEVKPENAAWVVFTSGSTGLPKGIILEHRALASSIRAHGEAFGFNNGSRVYQFAAHTFDVVIRDYFTTLIWGGTVCISSEHDRMNDLAAAMRSLDVNFAALTSTVARLIKPSDVPTLKTLLLGGEAVQAEVVEAWHKHASVFNSYGPAECSINSTSYGPIQDPSQASNIGYGSGTRLWVCHPSNPNQLCPIGVVGELLIEGPLLARGYLNDTKKTATSFIMDPEFTSISELGLAPGRRFYRTGDLVRQNEDGSLTCLGRRDTQCKIRGQRVEIGEIEFWISKNQPDARLVAVVITDRGQDQQTLVAAIELVKDSRFAMTNLPETSLVQPPTDEFREESDRLRASLLEVLPAYMVPNIYVPMSQIPLNTSGKLDRLATREIIDCIDTSMLFSYSAVRTITAPSTETERQLQMLWGQVLGMGVDISADANFFHIGGDSVAAMRIVAATRNSPLKLSVADIFKFPRLSELAGELDSRTGGEDSLEMEEVESEPFEMWKEAIGL